MKKVIASIFTALAFVGLAQPQKINYQGVAVGANGKSIKNASVGLRFSVLDSLPTGSTLYTETQSASTDAAGQFSIYLGAGTATLGTFANIPWANGNDKFLKVEMDAQGGSNYQSMGTTQLVSVPFAMAAGSLREGAILYGNNGQKFQLVNGANGPVWTCYPPVIQANAGNDQLNVCSDNLVLSGNTAAGFSSNWLILSGTGGNIVGNTFTGTRGNAYTLRYTLSNACGSSSDTLQISLALPTSTSSAGPDQLSLTGTTATLAANAPAAGETGAWTIISGSGASLNNANSSTATLTKGTDSAYTLVWTISGSCGTSRDTVNIHFSVPVSTVCGQSVTYAGETYPTVQIGNQCWFTKNLNVGTMIPGNVEQTTNSTIEKYCYNNDSNLCATYGGLYQWGEAVQYQNGASNLTSPNSPFFGHVAGICPTGWHIPSESEFCSLGAFLDGSVDCSSFGFTGSDVGQKLKSASGLWVANSGTGGSNSSGFSALPSGLRASNFSFNSLGQRAFFGTSSENSSSDVIYFGFDFSQLDMAHSIDYKGNGFSYRCLKN